MGRRKHHYNDRVLIISDMHIPYQHPDSGLPHINHVACNAMFLVHFNNERLQLNGQNTNA